MSNFWSFWIISLTTITIIGVTWILIANRTVQKKDGENTTGHVYDGIEEYDNPLPLWWFNLFLSTVVFSVIYLIFYPGMGNFKGYLNWTSSNQWENTVDEANREFNEKSEKFITTSAGELVNTPEAVNMGKRIFKSYCSTCHGTQAKGAYAFPNLTDNDWLYGGTEESIKSTIIHGRKGLMPAWETVLGNDIDNMADYVASLNKGQNDSHIMHEKFVGLCSACHGADGKGNLAFGAPNLTDNIWLYGGKLGDIKISIAKGRNGNMPAHETILSPASIHLVTAYILSLNKE